MHLSSALFRYNDVLGTLGLSATFWNILVPLNVPERYEG